MSGHRPWREIRAEKERRDRERGRTPIRAHPHEPNEPCDETCHELADRFIHTRGPHEGQPSDGEHVCVPECYEDQSHALADATYVEPQPLSEETRRRALSWLRADRAPTLVVATGWSVAYQRADSHGQAELRVELHPSLNSERVKLRLIDAVMKLNADMQREWREQRDDE